MSDVSWASRVKLFMIMTTFVGCLGENQQTEKLTINKDTPKRSKVFYSLGMQYARALEELNLSKSEQKHFINGVRDQFDGSSQITDADAQFLAQQADQFRIENRKNLAKEEKLLGQKKVEQLLKEDESYQQHTSGLVYKIIEKGKTVKIKPSGHAHIQYRSLRLNGEEYESTMMGDPRVLPIKGIFKAWQIALKLAGIGGKIEIIAPPHLTYGDNGALPYVKPGEYLKFYIEFKDYSAEKPKR